MENLHIEVRKDLLFYGWVYWRIRELLVIRSHNRSLRILFTETVERSITFSTSTIEYTLYWSNTVHGLILHIVREEHQLCYIDEATELAIWETLVIHTPSLCYYTFSVIWLLYLDETKRQTIYKEGYIRTELFLTVLASKLCRTMESVILWMLEVNKPCRRYRL